MSEVSQVAGPLADWGTRVLATLIDWALNVSLVLVGFLLVFTFGVSSAVLGILAAALTYLAVIATNIYFSYMTGACGQSPGKKVMGIKVVNERTGQVIGGGLGFVRWLAHALDSILFIGYLFPLWDPKRQTLADKVMNTVVLSGIPRQRLSGDVLRI